MWQKSHTFLRLSTLSIVNPLDVFAFRSDIGKGNTSKVTLCL